jgi:hypothetical protein
VPRGRHGGGRRIRSTSLERWRGVCDGLPWAIAGSVLLRDLGLKVRPRDLDLVTTIERFDEVAARLAAVPSVRATGRRTTPCARRASCASSERPGSRCRPDGRRPIALDGDAREWAFDPAPSSVGRAYRGCAAPTGGGVRAARPPRPGRAAAPSRRRASLSGVPRRPRGQLRRYEAPALVGARSSHAPPTSNASGERQSDGQEGPRAVVARAVAKSAAPNRATETIAAITNARMPVALESPCSRRRLGGSSAARRRASAVRSRRVSDARISVWLASMPSAPSAVFALDASGSAVR